VKGLLEDARRSSTVVAGGDPFERDGYFVQPTIVRDLPDGARLLREEQFGPSPNRLSACSSLAMRI
jgi:acyl-CoA reductase-like NAD-dependent aldehyde dehydrogenase